MAELVVYCDGSYLSDSGIGAWAFYIPELDVYAAGSGEGTSAQRFELKAVVAGIKYAMDVCPGRAVWIMTDCVHSTYWVSEVRLRIFGISQRSRMPATDADLIAQLDKLLRMVAVTVERATSGNDPKHKLCHSLCSRESKALAARILRRRNSRPPWYMRALVRHGFGRIQSRIAA